MVVRPALLYGAECLPIKKTQTHRLMVAKMRMIQWMCGYNRFDRIRNVEIREKVGVAPIKDKMRETRLRRCISAPVRGVRRLPLRSIGEREDDRRLVGNRSLDVI